MTDVSARITATVAERYRIERELGAGGMATVYLAEDIRHRRKVAIKVLHPELSAVLGPDRFLKEIELTANLQHPHILPLFDSGNADGLLYYVMPYVEGETLRGLLSRERQLAVPQAVRIASEVADALDYAHKRKVIHRDVKPENILLHDGRALVADFGIALAVQQAGGERMTQTGMSLGTPQYMAPEQAMGDRSVDHRADIYALGAVTYEMLAGEPPFTGPTPQAIVAKVITEKPRPLREVRDTVPRHVAAAVHAALQKLAADRPASAAEFAAGLATATAASVTTDDPVVRGFDRRIAAAAALAMLAVAGAAGFVIGGRSNIDDSSRTIPSRLSILAPAVGGVGPAGLHRQIALTPDGSAVVYVIVSPAGENGLAYQRLDALEPTILPGTNGMLNPIVSPDGRSVAGGGGALFGNRIAGRKIAFAGGQAVDMPAGLRFDYAFWAPDGKLWFSPVSNGELSVLGLDGKIQRKLGEKTRSLRIQQLLGDGRTALMARIPTGTGSGPVVLVDVETGVESPLVDIPVIEVRYTSGYL
ncbi:MAG: serine/threonine protein kinase, partial [Gemmatimonadota bacterium]|nr:serine/threonine protein kinase [Gemmatimonadota bacterium]